MTLLLVALILAGVSIVAGLLGGNALVRYVSKASDAYHQRELDDDMRGASHA